MIDGKNHVLVFSMGFRELSGGNAPPALHSGLSRSIVVFDVIRFQAGPIFVDPLANGSSGGTQ